MSSEKIEKLEKIANQQFKILVKQQALITKLAQAAGLAPAMPTDHSAEQMLDTAHDITQAIADKFEQFKKFSINTNLKDFSIKECHARGDGSFLCKVYHPTSTWQTKQNGYRAPQFNKVTANFVMALVGQTVTDSEGRPVKLSTDPQKLAFISVDKDPTPHPV